jgi:hypothetical protein
MASKPRPARWFLPLALAVTVAPILVLGACKRHPTTDERPRRTWRATDPKPGGATEAECEAWWSSADAQLTKVVSDHAACTSDEDCETMPGPSGCLASCFVAIARSGRAAYHTTKERVCKDWESHGCYAIAPHPIPSCVMLTARCRNARCTAVDEHR